MHLFELQDRSASFRVLFIKDGEPVGHVELSLHLPEQQVRDQEYLCCGVDKIDGKIVVSIGRVVVDPELPGDGGEHGGCQQHAENYEGLLHEWKEVREKRKQR